jgi:uncharacterized protein (DUF1330 family)
MLTRRENPCSVGKNRRCYMDGLCECGCGEITNRSPKTSAKEKIKQGDHRRFCFGHQNRRLIKNHDNTPKRGQFYHVGYVYVIAPPDHPHKTNKKYIKRSRLVMEEKIGRYLSHHEQVHHVNGDRGDDRPENLVIMSLSNHLSYHRKLKREAKNA